MSIVHDYSAIRRAMKDDKIDVIDDGRIKCEDCTNGVDDAGLACNWCNGAGDLCSTCEGTGYVSASYQAGPHAPYLEVCGDCYNENDRLAP